MNPGAHDLPTMPSFPYLRTAILSFPDVSIYFLNVFIHFNPLSYLFLSVPSILPVQCNAMGHSSLILTFPFFSCHCSSLISYLFYLVAHYIAERFCIEKKYRIIIFFIPPCNENICAPLQKFREDLSDRPLHCPRRLHLRE